MKKTLLFVLLVFGFTLNAYSETFETEIILGANYANRIYFSIPNQLQTEAENSSWHIGFQTSSYDAGIFVNDAMGVTLYHALNNAVDNWDSPVTIDNLETWDMYYNENDTWNVGAFNMGNDGFNDGTGDYGWGGYDPSTHMVLGTTWYVIKFGDTYKKIMVDSRVSNEYTLLTADLDGANEEELVVPVYEYQDKLFVYYNLESQEVVDLEPLQSDWDLVFTRYIEVIDMGGQDFPQGVTGVKNNKGVAAAMVLSTNPYTAEIPEPEEFMEAIDFIGYDWKIFDMENATYDVADDRAYFVRSLDDNIYKIIFQEFDGSSTGRILFELIEMSTSVDATSIDGLNVSIYPNVLDAGSDFNLVLDSEITFDNITINVIDILGNDILTRDLSHSNSLTAHSINTGNIASGVYYAIVSVNGQRSIQKFIIR